MCIRKTERVSGDADCIKVKELWLLSPWKPRGKKNGASFYHYFYLTDQRFDAHSVARVLTEYDLQSGQKDGEL